MKYISPWNTYSKNINEKVEPVWFNKNPDFYLSNVNKEDDSKEDSEIVLKDFKNKIKKIAVKDIGFKSDGYLER